MKFSKKLKFFVLICFFLFLISIFTAYLNCIVRPILFSQSEAHIKSYITSVIAKSLDNQVFEELYDDTFKFSYNSDGTISAFSSNLMTTNKISAYLTSDILEKIKNEDKMNFKISAGTLSGIPFFYGKGPDFSIKLTPLFGITCDITSHFTDSGINQTLHTLKLNIHAQTAIKEPLSNDKISIHSSVPLSETIIVGDVPEAYTVILRADVEDEDDINDYAATLD